MDDYERDKIFLGWMMKDLVETLGLPAEQHPLAVLAKDEAKAPTRARAGLRMAINDMVEMTTDWSPAEVGEADTALRAIGGSTLTEVRSRYSRHLAAVEKRGRIRSETEAYLVTGVLDGDVDALAADRRQTLQSIFEAYEASVSRG